MKINHKSVFFVVCFLLFSVAAYVSYVVFYPSGKGRDFNCNADLFLEDTQQKEMLDAKFSLVMTSDNRALMDIVGTVKKEGVRYGVNRKIYFDYIDNESKGFIYFKKKKEEGYTLDNKTANGAFNRLMFGDKQTLYAAINKLGNGAYEISDTLNPVLVCYQK